MLNNKVICQFKFICPLRWEGLAPIDGDSKTRFCKVCKSPVYLTKSYAELEVNIAAKRCVAMFVDCEDGSQEFMGLVIPEDPDSRSLPNTILFRSIDELEVTNAVSEVLKFNNIQLVGDLVAKSEAQLSDEFGLSDEQVAEIQELLICRNLRLA